MEKTALPASHLGTISMSEVWLIDLYCPGEIQFPSACWPKTRVGPFVIQDTRRSSDLFSCMHTYTSPVRTHTHTPYPGAREVLRTWVQLTPGSSPRSSLCHFCVLRPFYQGLIITCNTDLLGQIQKHHVNLRREVIRNHSQVSQ